MDSKSKPTFEQQKLFRKKCWKQILHKVRKFQAKVLSSFGVIAKITTRRSKFATSKPKEG